MSLALLVPAQQELDDAIAWYSAQAPGFGDAFLVEVLRAFELIQHHPDAWHPLSDRTRRCRLSRFPYGVIYTQEGHDVLVLAIAHLHRQPGYWRKRLKEPAP